MDLFSVNFKSSNSLQVQDIKMRLQEVVADPQLGILTEVLIHAREIPYLLSWHHDDVELADLFEKAAELEEELKNVPEETPEEVEHRNSLRDELKAALENDVDR